jgi:tetratricopeptide (TPR) repeat protein
MAKRKVAETTVVEAQEVQSTGIPFLEKNQNLLLYVLGGIAVAVAAWFGYRNLIVEPNQKEAVTSMWQAQAQFERDSFKLALENPGGGFDGFLTIIDKYGGTPAGNMAKYYAAICYMQTGDFDNAISKMESFSAKGDILPALKQGVLGDLYSEKKEFDKAANHYDNAVDAGKNDVLSAYYLKKLGMLYDYQGKSAEALKAYERLKKDFPNPNSQDWRDIDKYIYRAGGTVN